MGCCSSKPSDVVEADTKQAVGPQQDSSRGQRTAAAGGAAVDGPTPSGRESQRDTGREGYPGVENFVTPPKPTKRTPGGSQSKYIVVTDHSPASSPVNKRRGPPPGFESSASSAGSTSRIATPSGVTTEHLAKLDSAMSGSEEIEAPGRTSKNKSPNRKILHTSEMTRLCGLGPRDATYEMLKTLGEGGYSKVRLARDRDTGEEFAIKIINKKRLNNQQRRDQLTREVEIMLQLHHPNVVVLHDAFESDSKMYIVTEVMKGGELLDRVIDDGNLSEKECCSIMKQLVAALQYLHQRGVIHRDIKPQNILLTSKDKDSPVKITDFGLSALVTPDKADLLKTAVGSPHFMAPEIMVSETYGGGVDVWSIGVVMYFLLSGLLPFDGESPNEVFKAIREGDFNFPDEFWAPISAEAKALIERIFVSNPAERIDLDEIPDSPWMQMEDELSTVPIPDVGVRIEALRHKTKGQFRANVRTIMAAVKFSRLSETYQKRKRRASEDSRSHLLDVQSLHRPSSQSSRSSHSSLSEMVSEGSSLPHSINVPDE